jgi:hypothetical protein
MASYFIAMAIRSVVLTLLFVLTAFSACAAGINCSNYEPETISRSILASDPNFIRIITGAVAEKCSAELAPCAGRYRQPTLLYSMMMNSAVVTV